MLSDHPTCPGARPGLPRVPWITRSAAIRVIRVIRGKGFGFPITAITRDDGDLWFPITRSLVAFLIRVYLRKTCPGTCPGARPGLP
ncbi:MAG TPA: hypothetical protein VI488_19910 [Candidatus Angelobacter sp.]